MPAWLCCHEAKAENQCQYARTELLDWCLKYLMPQNPHRPLEPCANVLHVRTVSDKLTLRFASVVHCVCATLPSLAKHGVRHHRLGSPQQTWVDGLERPASAGLLPAKPSCQRQGGKLACSRTVRKHLLQEACASCAMPSWVISSAGC